MPTAGGFGGMISRASGGAFDDPATLFGGGGGHDPSVLADLLRSLGINIPGGVNARQYGRAQILAQLLGRLNAPTGLERFYGPEFQSRGISSTVERSAAPYAEAGRALTGGYLQSGQGGGGQLTAARGSLARSQASTTGSAISDFLMDLEGRRAGVATTEEQIRSNRINQLMEFLTNWSSLHAAGKQAKTAQEGQAGAAIGGGAGNILSSLLLLLAL